MLQSGVASALPLFELQQLFLVGGILASLAIVRALSPAEWRWSGRLRRRFVLGVPWGTLLTILGVLSVYWFVQGGWDHPKRPMTIPFYSWSYFYPLGNIVSPFAHQGMGHLTGNLQGTLVYAPVVEYVVGHYPRERGSETFSSWRTNPYVRVLAVPVGALVFGLFTGLFTAGPVIGFSGVVFAFAGFALVSRPLLAVFALVSERVVSVVYSGLKNPTLIREPSPGLFSPWWADVAVQGHALGVLAGAGLAVLLLRSREERPKAMYLWLAAVIFGIRQSLWAIYRPRGDSEFVLYRAVGVGLVFLFAAVLASAVWASDRPISARIDLPRRKTAFSVVVVVLLGISAAAIPFGFASVSGDLSADATTVEVRDYTVTYVEGVPNQYAAFANEWLFGESAQIRSSGVVVVSEQRRIWYEATSKQSLAFNGFTRVRVGGVGWRETVYASRDGWSLSGSGTAYRVSIWRHGQDRKSAYETGPITAKPIIAGRNVSIAPSDDGFSLRVSRGNVTLGRAAMPGPANATDVGGLTLERRDRNLFAVYNDTRVQVATKSRAGRQQL